MDEVPLKDKVLICVDCNEEFVFTVAAQVYFLERGITEEPKRCKSCYLLIKKEKRSQERVPRRRENGERYVMANGGAHARNGNGRFNRK